MSDMVRTVALHQDRSQVCWFDPQSLHLTVCGPCFSSVSLFFFLQSEKNAGYSLTVHAKLTLGVNASVNGCLFVEL